MRSLGNYSGFWCEIVLNFLCFASGKSFWAWNVLWGQCQSWKNFGTKLFWCYKQCLHKWVPIYKKNCYSRSVTLCIGPFWWTSQWRRVQDWKWSMALQMVFML